MHMLGAKMFFFWWFQSFFVEVHYFWGDESFNFEGLGVAGMWQVKEPAYWDGGHIPTIVVTK